MGQEANSLTQTVGAFLILCVFDVIFIMLAFLGREKYLALFPIIGGFLAIYLVTTVGVDGTLVTGSVYNATTATQIDLTTPSVPLIYLPIFLTPTSFLFSIYKVTRR